MERQGTSTSSRAYLVLLHSRSTSSHPATERRELHRVGLVSEAQPAHNHAVRSTLTQSAMEITALEGIARGRGRVPHHAEASLELLADGAGLDAGHHALAIDPLDGVHHLHVERHDHAALVGQTLRIHRGSVSSCILTRTNMIESEIERGSYLEGLGDGGAAAVGNDDDVVVVRQANDRLDLLVRARPDHDVGDALVCAVSQPVDVLSIASAMD